MKWAFGIRRKISAALLFAAIFVLIFVKNMVDSQHVSQLGTSFSSVYEDRLMVESYIYRLSEHLFRKKIMIDTNSSAAADQIKPFIAVHTAAINYIISEYEKTKLTEAEAVYFKDFKDNVSELSALEDAYFGSMTTGADRVSIKELVDIEFNLASVNLGHLSSIQISEGKILNDHSKRIVAGSSILTQFEMGILISIGLMIMVLVFESTSVFTRSAHNQSMN